MSWIESRIRTFFENGTPVKLIGMLRDVAQTRLTRDSIGRSLRHMSDAFLAFDTDWRITYVNYEAERLLGPSASLLGRALWEVAPEFSTLGLEDRFRRTMGSTTPVDMEEKLPHTRHWYRIRLVPVPNGLTVFFTDINEQRLQEEKRARTERSTRERSDCIAELTRALAQSVTARDVFKTVADRILIPFQAESVTMHVVEGDRLRTVGSTIFPQAIAERLDTIRVTDDVPFTDVLHLEHPLFFSTSQEMVEQYPQAASYVALTGTQDKGWAILPMTVSDRPVGVCVLTFARPFLLGLDERTMLCTLMGLITQALERAHLYDIEHSRAQELQSGLLPRVLPSPPAVTAVARYLPTMEDTEVGGDWYDVIPLSAGRVALVIGDVMGHGLSEAATMGRLRTAVHTLAALELPPDEILAHLNDLVNSLGDAFYATCLYGVYDPTTGTCTLACAGHPPPAVVHPDGGVHFPGMSVNPPLGAAAPPFDTTEVQLPAGSLMVFYTDGLVESRTRDIDRGMAQLAHVIKNSVKAKHQLPHDQYRDEEIKCLNGLCDTVTSLFLGGSNDDAALLIARIHPLASQDVAVWSLPEDASAAGHARRHIQDQLAAWDLDDLTMTSELLVSELIANVVRHAKGPIRLRLLRSDVLVCEVSDGSLTTPHIRRAAETDEGGRGLQLVEALSQRWGTRYTSTGKFIWTEQPLNMAVDSHLPVAAF